MAMRVCTICKHGEHHHFGRECAGLLNWQCPCDGFCARSLSDAELAQMKAEKGTQRGQIGRAQVLDEYGAIREHLAEVMEKASK